MGEAESREKIIISADLQPFSGQSKMVQGSDILGERETIQRHLPDTVKLMREAGLCWNICRC